MRTFQSWNNFCGCKFQIFFWFSSLGLSHTLLQANFSINGHIVLPSQQETALQRALTSHLPLVNVCVNLT